ncbi:hypothetical protein PICMEDRAFT_78624 [Pichia membranifaciens NRRL Y-2026]|uniref:Uncharacterized protein n=1 Tax=Pichia membranifaciens NRRL Y-2026 TaxID=763406 RepID=A0A1E3NFD1_9ASCO|nr:hypothetical protein PICMEDRAFT_78624 [Pichia membranifaciens NRRL Y-2026]ODQ44847.1 hypothetical protein PICMEDRAFT_78624 [Pichia membranifaciens NRRL Y-2026]
MTLHVLCLQRLRRNQHWHEPTTGLTTYFELNDFRSWLKKEYFPDDSIVYAVEIKLIMYYLFFHFVSKEHLMSLDVASTGTMVVVTAMSSHAVGIFDRYLTFWNTAYFYLLNVGKYQNAVEMNKEIVDKIKVLRDSVGDATDKQAYIIYARLEDKARLLAEIMVLMINDHAFFSFPIKAPVLDETGTETLPVLCQDIQVILAVHRGLAHDTNGKRAPREFPKAFEGERGYQPLKNFSAVYAIILEKRDNYTDTMARILTSAL